MKFYFLLLLTCLSSVTFGQEANIKINQKHLDNLILSALEYNLALDKLKVQIEANDIEKKITNSEHIGLVTVSGNLNEFSIRELSGDNTIANFYPRYNIGVRIPLNHFSNVMGRKKLLAKNQEMILLESEEVTRQLEKEVTEKYIEYIKQVNFLNLQRRLEQFSLADFKATEQKFAQGELGLDKYGNSRNAYYANKMRLLEAESQYLRAKNELEALVNAKLSDLGIE